jgi:two-component system, OmpR family, response regulator
MNGKTNGKERKALLIDDETDICYLLSLILKKLDIQSVSASSLDETDHVIQSGESFNLIFLDNHLPDGLGVSYIQKLKKRYPGTALIMITAQDSKAEEANAKNSGIDYFISKPFSSETILNTIGNHYKY